MKCCKCDGTGCFGGIPEADPLTGKIPEVKKCSECNGTGEVDTCFTPGPWILGIPFRHKGSSSEWCNIYASDGDSNHIAEVLLFDGVNKNYYNANLIAAAPEMRDCICDALSDLQMPEGMRRHFEEVLKQANGGKELPESKWKE